MDENLVEYQQMLKAADAQMAKEIEDISLGKEQFKKETQLSRCSLMHKSTDLEKTYLLLPDPLFKYYILCCFIIIHLIFIINGLTTTWFSGFQWYTWTIFTIVTIALFIMQPLTWFQFLWIKYKGIEEPRNTFLRSIYDTSTKIIKSAYLRTFLYVIISIGLAACAVVTVIGCAEIEINEDEEKILSNCVSSWHVTHCWGLALLLNFLFSRVFFLFKWLIAGGMTIFYLWVVWETKTFLFAHDTTWNVGLDPRVSHTLAVVFITMTLYFVDRNTEFRNRLDHLWQIQLIKEQDEAETMLKVNSMLLENILPGHVVRLYLNINRSIDELYYEKYDNVAVMFASLTDYKLGVEDDSDLGDKYMLRIMDEVISDFDRLLLTGTSHHTVEKIKMAGWTYMAACGLNPNRRDSFDSTSVNSVMEKHITQDCKTIVITMVQFAAAMFMQLHNFNKGSFQRFEGMNLRVGISNGEVAAGVIGSLKPLYDIWGHAVNMASRMDSTGETGRIQVTENTAIILEECGIITRYRGKTFVKGAGYIRTYFVPLDENYNLIKKENSADYFRTQDRAHYYSIRNEMFNETDEEDVITKTELKLHKPLLNGDIHKDISPNSLHFEEDSAPTPEVSFTARDTIDNDNTSTISTQSEAESVEICETRC